MLSKLLRPEIQELIESGDLKSLKEITEEWEPAEIADLLTSIKEEEQPVFFRLLSKSRAAIVFSYLDSDSQEKLLRNLSNEYISKLLTELEPDDRTALFEELPGEITQRLLSLLSDKEKRDALKLLGYPEDSVGRLMTDYYVKVYPDMKIKDALKTIKKYGKNAETIDMIYVVDKKGRLIDDIPLGDIVLADSNKKIEDIMDYNYISLSAYDDKEKAAQIMQKYDRTVLPVVDSDNVLIGIVTVDDMMDVIQEEATEDFTKISGIEAHPVGLDVITKIKDVPVTKLYRSRVVWLIFLLFMDFITGGIIQGFEQTIAKYVVLVTFLPVLVDTAGNAGSQSATLVIRAMAVGTIQMRDWFILLGRELLIAGLLGLTMSLGISFMGIWRSKNILVASVVVSSMFINVLVGSLIGIILPFIFTKLKKDPATASTPLITTLADIIGTGIYLFIAYLILR
uniref:Magnesium transporter MgtE n=1 Tax=candidate division WOR-3 bacterium TaxID=2052148 RepID=A0A7C4YD88_UNCW3